MDESVITYRGVVYPWHCDHMGHMNVMWYVGKFDEACWQMLSMLGLSPSRLKTEHASLAPVEQHNQYKRELYAGDPITIRSTILRIGTSSIRMMHKMADDTTGEIAATSNVIGVYLSATRRKAQPFPMDVRECAKRLADRSAADFPDSVCPWKAFNREGGTEVILCKA